MAPASISSRRAISLALSARPLASIHSGRHCASVRSSAAMRCSTSRRIIVIRLKIW
jgi:hypothetical protein